MKSLKGKRLYKGDVPVMRTFTAVTGMTSWDVNLYFRLKHIPGNRSCPKGINGRIWERDFHGDDNFKGK